MRVFLILFALVLSLDFWVHAEEAPKEQESEESTHAIEIVEVESIRALYEAAKGKVLVVNFWATWCVPCVREMPELVDFYDEFKNRG